MHNVFYMMSRWIAHSLPFGQWSIAYSQYRLHSLRVQFGLFVHVDHIDFTDTRRFAAANAEIEPGAILILVGRSTAIGFGSHIEFGIDDLVG